MANQLKNFIKGIGRALEIYPYQNYIIPQRYDGFLAEVVAKISGRVVIVTVYLL